MKCAVLCAVVVASCLSQATSTNPIKKVLQMISNLQDNIIREGTTAQKLYTKKTVFCEHGAKKMMFEIKTGKSEIGDLGATIDQQNAAISKAHSKIETLSSDLSTNEADLKAASAIRDKDAADFSANEKELRTVINSLDRSMGVLTKEMAKKKGGASMLQLTSADSITDAISVLVRGSDLSSEDASRVTAMMQETEQSQDGDEGQMERAESMFSGQKKDGIVGTLEGFLEKAEQMLEKSRKTEQEGRQNFKMLRQSLTDELKYGNKDLVDCKKRLAEAQEKRAIAKGDLAVTSKDLKGDIKARAALHHDCMAAATEFEAATVSRSEELKAISHAKKVIVETTGGAEKQAYGLDQVSLLEVSSSSSSSSQAASFKVVRFVRNLAHEQHSSALAQLASRMVSAVRLGATSGRSPFGKVKNLIGDMLRKLEKEGADEGSRKAYCDKEMSETKAKKEEITTQVSGLTTKVDQRKAASSKLKDEVSTLQKELADMASSIGVATQMRNEENAAYKKSKAEMLQGLTGVRLALKLLRDYYAKDEKPSLVQVEGGGGGASIIGFLEVVESDLTKGMAEMTAEENTLASKYKDFAQANKEESAKKQQDVKYKTREFKSLDKAVAELSGDLAGVQDERDAILEYDAKIKKACVAKAEPYEEKKKRRDAEIAGLKEAIGTLEQSTSLLQMASKRTLRGSRASQ